MLITAILLLAYTIMGGHSAWYQSGGFEAQCLFDDLIGNIGYPFLMSYSIGLLVVSYSWKILWLYDGPSEFINVMHDRFSDSMNAIIVLAKQRKARSSEDFWTTILSKAWWSILIGIFKASKPGYTLSSTLGESKYLGFVFG